MTYISTTDKEFLTTLQEWLCGQREILLLIRYADAAGAKDFEFLPSFDTLAERLRGLPPRASVIVFRQPQLPIRGIVDDDFITTCQSSIPDGSEYLILSTRRTGDHHSAFHWSAGESHAELREDLEDLRGVFVAVGFYPPWLEDTKDVISGYVPDEDGVVRPGDSMGSDFYVSTFLLRARGERGGNEQRHGDRTKDERVAFGAIVDDAGPRVFESITNSQIASASGDTCK